MGVIRDFGSRELALDAVEVIAHGGVVFVGYMARGSTDTG